MRDHIEHREVEKERVAAEFQQQCRQMQRIFLAIGREDPSLRESLYEELVVAPVKIWRKLFQKETKKSQFFEAFIGSTTSWIESPGLDLPDRKVENHLNNVVMPRLRYVCGKLKIKIPE